MRRAILYASFVLIAGLAGPGAAQSPTSPPSRSLLEMPIRSSSLIVKVPDYEAARSRVLRAAQQAGAELVDTHTEVDDLGKKNGWIRLRVTSSQLPALLGAVREVGKLYSEQFTADERVSEYQETERRVERLREHQARLSGMLENGRRLRGSDLLYIQERLFRAEVDEGLLMQRRVDLERMVRSGSVVVELFEPEPRRQLDVGNWYAGAALRAKTSLFRFLAKGVTAGAYVLFFAPLWIPALVIALLLVRWLWRRLQLLGRWCAARVTRAYHWVAVRFPARPLPSDPASST